MSFIVILSLFIPLVGTSLGSAMVFFLKKELNPKVQKVLMGFASGVMIAAAFWSLLSPSIESYTDGDFRKWFVPAIGFLLGVGFMLLLDYLIPHIHLHGSEEGVRRPKLSRTFKFFLAVTLHNIPEGLAVGVVVAGMMNGNINEQAMLVLAIGIAIQNLPEGMIVSLPLKEEGMSKWKAFGLGTLSGVVEPIASLIALGLTSLIVVILPYTLAFAAGVMVYVVVEELIPEASQDGHSNLGTIGFTVGFIIMMILEILLG
ncbi:MAG: ZIP family metal transporter [Bacilli bacterium]|nr:ZIP family metal transporter [Bacilli bacterium]MDY6362951.1 ZIP family metal transporter [Bacilli bacterium]